ncbi:putative phosphoglucomutase [Tripterygium wilfordii]|uniref:Phosphoacetylglucosamine mutase n=1 Tax=Tripterygium wilfordii TaxID=458696 RepID=A0A7J7C6B2_TRIWF|nr:phosphoacetylglucosamine mutase [Tripterygium wilfordii]KAF5729674.1 putative phosphoglucomutase [Tripterygium wilfordii]
MNEEQTSLLLHSCSRFPPPKGVRLSYGTAGFREDASILQSTVFRVGILAALRSLKTRSVIGLMITASHNKVSDNGVKIADPNGGMLSQDWEPFADALANAPTPEQFLQLLTDFVKKENIPFDGQQSAEILLGRDTRPSGGSLLEAAKQGISSIIGAVFYDMGIVTSPQLHWMVRARNKGMKATELDYFDQLSSSFRCLIDLIPYGSGISKTVDDILVVDGANGVGGEKLEALKKMLDDLVIDVRNCGKGSGILNEGVGADYVQKEKVIPQEFGSMDVGLRCASLDGDADRLVYFSVPSNVSSYINLVDGDKILSLFAIFIKEQLSILQEAADEKVKAIHHARVGVVQTAYANGASTEYLKQLGLEVVFTPTGVKYLHDKAAQYDIGIYFEANGHGTILFSESFVASLETIKHEPSSASIEQHNAVLRLLAVSKLINQAVGDALSGLLMVEAILRYMGWSIQKWSDLYQDLPSRMLKVKVVDRTAVVTTNAETVVAKPPGIQEAIDAETAKYPQGRSFIRPSGTEDVIRVYAEASSQEGADNLASSVAKLVDRFLGFGSSS